MEVLASMDFSELPTIDPLTGAVSWRDPGGIRFSRFGHPITATPTDGAAKEAAFWQGWREIGASELRQLAEAIVTEVRARGPFLSFADFVNRNPDSSDVKHQRKGALQAALDTALNNNLPAEVARAAENPVGARFSEAIAGENQAGGHASYLLQGDLLQSLAPVMQVRSDSFRIRGYGETRDPSGRVIARVWCEALVQRTASYMDPADRPETLPSGLVSELNRTYGRRFEVVGFRWLAPEEL